LARTERFLDPEIYQPGRFITFTGTLVGTERHRLGEREHLYPVFALETAYLWSPYQRTYYPGYYPFYPWHGPYYGYPYRWPHWGVHPFDPFWYDPFWHRPHFRRW
jgi:outer membrane lipoprotein